MNNIKRSHSNNVLSIVHHGIDSIENTDDEDSEVDSVCDRASRASSRRGSTNGPQLPAGVPVPEPPALRRNSSVKARSMINVAEMAVACAAGLVTNSILFC